MSAYNNGIVYNRSIHFHSTANVKKMNFAYVVET